MVLALKTKKILMLFVLLLLAIPLEISTKLLKASFVESKHEAILVLDGDASRIEVLPKIMNRYPMLPIFISGDLRHKARYLSFLNKFEVDINLITYDCRATDTVTNFTTLVEKFVTEEISTVYLVTSNYHMPRARAISFIVLGSRGIYIHPIAVESTGKDENKLKIARDVMRSLLWLLTGYTGVTLDPSLSEYQKKQIKLGGCPN